MAKSRSGCIVCKKRKIKCDEGHPSCGNCLRRRVECAYRVSIDQLSHNPSFPVITSAGTLDVENLKLLHQYTTNTYLTLSRIPETNHVWQTLIPQLAFSNDSLIHSILSLSALHLQILYPQTTEYSLIATTHFTNAIDTLSNSTVLVQFLSVTFRVPFYLLNYTRDPDGLRTMDYLQLIRDAILVVRQYKSQIQSTPFRIVTDLNENLITDPIVPLALTRLCTDTPDADELKDPVTAQVYHYAIEHLIRVWPMATCPINKFFAPLVWIASISDRLLIFLYEKRPRALVLLRFFYLMVGHVQECWWFRDLLQEIPLIDQILDDQWKMWLYYNEMH